MRFFKQVLNLLLELWPLVIGGLLYLAITPLEDAYLFPAVGQSVDYPFMLQSRTWIASFTLCILPSAILFIGIWVGVRIARKADIRFRPIINVLAGIGAIGILLYANQLMCIQSFGLAMSNFGNSQSIQVEGHTYYVNSIWKIGVGMNSSAYFVFFECDTDGKMCQNVFNKLYHVDEKAYRKMTTALIPDFSKNSITLQINGEAVYVHEVK